MSVHNADIAAQFNRMAELLEIEGANQFRVRAYRRAAATIDDLPESCTKMLAEGKKLNELPGIGDDLAGKIKEICDTGHLMALEEVEARTPSTLAALTAIPGLGPKRVKLLHDKLGIASVPDLAKAAKAGKLRDLPRFGATIEKRILNEITKGKKAEQRFKVSTAEDFAAGLTDYLKKGTGVGNVRSGRQFPPAQGNGR